VPAELRDARVRLLVGGAHLGDVEVEVANLVRCELAAALLPCRSCAIAPPGPPRTATPELRHDTLGPNILGLVREAQGRSAGLSGRGRPDPSSRPRTRLGAPVTLGQRLSRFGGRALLDASSSTMSRVARGVSATTASRVPSGETSCSSRRPARGAAGRWWGRGPR
jgi:hypothetical protein